MLSALWLDVLEKKLNWLGNVDDTPCTYNRIMNCVPFDRFHPSYLVFLLYLMFDRESSIYLLGFPHETAPMILKL